MTEHYRQDIFNENILGIHYTGVHFLLFYFIYISNLESSDYE